MLVAIRHVRVALTLLLLPPAAWPAPNTDVGARDMALWRIVDTGCGAATAVPSPGLECDVARGYAVLKDRCGPTHYLVLPTARRVGIESPELLRPEEPNYLALAWAERWRSLGARTAAVDAADVGLAVNSRYGRSQSQLHVHIDFVRPDVRAALAALPRPIAAGTRVELMGHRYRVDPLGGLAGDPIARVVRAWGATDDGERARLTLAVVGDDGGGVLLLSDRADLAALDRGHAEELLRERDCR
jgi:CDP-diacylglycerol pyrophosphatase